MILYGDYHTHTKFSDGKNSVLENAMMAKRKGLKEIAITDHGFGHLKNGIKLKDIEKLKYEVEDAQKKTGIKVLLGVEANLISLDGKLDLKKEYFEIFDLILMGYHYTGKPSSLSNFFHLFLGNVTPFIKNSKKQIESNTNAIVKALESYPIDILTHMGYGMNIDYMKVAKKAKAVDTYIELNGKRINFSDDIICQMATENVKLVINSDAHKSENIGECNNAFNICIKNNIDVALLGNVDKPLLLKRK